MRGNLAMAMHSSRHAMNDMTDSFLLPHPRNERKQVSHDSRDRRFSLLKSTVFTVVSRRSHKHVTERDTKLHSFTSDSQSWQSNARINSRRIKRDCSVIVEEVTLK